MSPAAGVLVERAAPASADAAQPHDPIGVPAGDGRAAERPRVLRWGPLLLAFALYLAVASAVWWHLFAQGFGTVLPSGSADPGQEVWFLAWLPHALATGQDPFFTNAIFFRPGVNLLDNTSMELLGLLLAPVTVTAGPVASFDLAVLLAPACSALAAFALCRRYVTWSPAAFAGGLCYGFGPFLTGDLRYGHLDLTWLVLPPLIFCCLDTLLLRGTRRPVPTGAALGILVVAQFFVSTEMLAITAVTAAVVAMVFVLADARSAFTAVVAARRGLGCAAAIVVVVLAYPFWLVVAGARHVVGPVWHHIGAIATSLAATVEPHGQLAGVAFISGSNGSYLGVALLAVLVAGAIVLRRSSVLGLALLTALIAYLASLGYSLHVGHRHLHFPLPGAVFGRIPLLESIVPERFAAMVDLLCGLALAVIVDRIRRWRAGDDPAGDQEESAVLGTPSAAEMDGARSPGVPPAPLLVALALAVAAFALVPFVAVPRWPYAVTTASRPAAFLAGAPGKPTGTQGNPPVLAIYPDSSSWVAREMVWQADDGFSFTLADGYAIVPGHHGRAVEAPRADALWLVFAAGSVNRLPLPLTTTTRAAVRADLRSTGVDEVVVLPGAQGSLRIRRALREVLGRPPSEAVHGVVFWRVRPGRA